MIGIERARSILILMFLGSFALQAVAVGITWIQGAIYVDELNKTLVTLLTVYSMPLGVIVGGMFGQETREPNPTRARLAIILSAVWNLLLVGRTLAVGLGSGGVNPIGALSEYWMTVSSAGGFLIGGALAYFFASEAR
jgi:hypothetical protein